MSLSFKHPLAIGRKTGTLYTPSTYKNEEPLCCLCGCDRTLLIKRPGNEINKRYISTHFAYKTLHIFGRDCGFTSGESFNHLYAKRLLYEKFEYIQFDGPGCMGCHQRKPIQFERDNNTSIAVEKKVGLYRPDVTVFAKGDDAVWALEVYETHEKGEQQVRDMTLAGLCVAEFKATEIIRMLEAPTKGTRKKLTNLIPGRSYNDVWECTKCEYKNWWATEWRPDAEIECLKEKEYQRQYALHLLELFHVKVAEFESKDKAWRRHAMSVAQDILERSATKKTKYSPEANLVKCGSCSRWVYKADCKYIDKRNHHGLDIDWWFNNTSSVCSECFMDCYSCGRICLVQQVAKYARCKECNIWIRNLRTMQNPTLYKLESLDNCSFFNLVGESPWSEFVLYLRNLHNGLKHN